MNLGRMLVGLMLVASAAGCGSSGTTTVDTAMFEGTWTFDRELVSGSCAGFMLNQDLAGRSMTLTKTTGAELLLSLFDKCMLTFTASSTTMATVNPGQKCTIPVTGLGEQEVDVTSWTLTITNATTLTTEQKGTVLNGMCTAMGSGAATKQ
jgi:hypothetical protein